MTSAYTINEALNYAVRTVVAQCGKSRNFSRKSSLSRETIIRLLIGAEGGSLDKILHTAGIKVTASAVSQRRAQINPSVFRAAFTSFNSDCTDNASFHGYRVLSVDGTTVNLPRNPASPSFVCNDGIPKGVNQLHATPLYDILSRTFTDVVIQPESKKDEIGALITMLQRNAFDRKTLIVADRGFEGYNLTAHLLEKPNTDFLSGEFETVATSLPRSFSLEDIKTLYHLCWGIETSFRDLKYTLGLVNLHGKSDSFAEQGIYSSLTAFNFASRVCREVVVRQPTEGIYAYKANFKMAVALCKECIRTPKADGDKLMESIARYTVPVRPGRQDQRDLRINGFPGFVYRVAA